MSLQSMYSVLQGDQQLFGLAMGVYDLAMIAVAPGAAYYVDKTDMCIYMGIGQGNADAWKVVIVARAIMGIGSVNIMVGSTYITKHTTFKSRNGVLGTYQQFQTLGRMVGPMIGFLFLWLPFPTPTSGTATLLFNFYTMNGWLMTFLSVLGLVIVLVMFRNDNVPTVKDDRPPFDFKHCAKGPGSLFYKVCINVVVIFFVGYVAYGIVSQLFGFAAAQFKVIHDQYDLWIPFTGLGAGAMSGAIIWRRIAKALRETHPRQETAWACLGLVFSIIVPFCFILYSPPTSPADLLYAGSVLVGLSQVITLGNMEVVFSKQITQHGDEVGSSVAVLFSIYSITLAASRFAGPFITAFIIPIADTATGGGKPCLTSTGEFNVTSTCCFLPSGFQTSTCELLNVDIYIPVLAAVVIAASSLGIYYLSVIVDYTGHENYGAVDSGA